MRQIRVTQPPAAMLVAVAPRRALIETATTRVASEGQQTKMEPVYQCLTPHASGRQTEKWFSCLEKMC